MCLSPRRRHVVTTLPFKKKNTNANSNPILESSNYILWFFVSSGVKNSLVDGCEHSLVFCREIMRQVVGKEGKLVNSVMT